MLIVLENLDEVDADRDLALNLCSGRNRRVDPLGLHDRDFMLCHRLDVVVDSRFGDFSRCVDAINRGRRASDLVGDVAGDVLGDRLAEQRVSVGAAAELKSPHATGSDRLQQSVADQVEDDFLELGRLFGRDRTVVHA